ncbi:MAG TPA: hypothetical protein GX705_00430 [Clostridiales bacterium]|nr:hypothetical protein [Clostridiales bacterium]
MDKLEQENIPRSRSEVIRLARESCARNLTPTSRRIGKHYQGIPIKSLAIRFVCALAIFLTIITISKLDGKYNTNYGAKIEGWVIDNVRLEKAEDFFVSIIEKVNNNYFK